MELRLHMVSHTGEMPYKVSSACLRGPYEWLLGAGTKEEGASLCFRAAWPSPSGEQSAPAPFPGLWQPAEGCSPSLSQNVLQGGTKARRFLWPYMGFVFHVGTVLPSPVHRWSCLCAEIAVWGVAGS